MKTDICKCGNPKDNRAIRCRKCIDLEKASKPCKGCGKCEPDVVFGKRYYECTQSGRGWKRRSRCKECDAKASREFRKTNPEEVKKRKKQWEIKYPEKHKRGIRRRRWRKLGLNPDYVENIFSKHSGLCEICGNPPGIYEELSADHSHNTKKFRGFLCYRCNLGIGQFDDNPDLLIKASEYLIQHNQEPFGIQAPVQPLKKLVQ